MVYEVASLGLLLPMGAAFRPVDGCTLELEVTTLVEILVEISRQVVNKESFGLKLHFDLLTVAHTTFWWLL